MSLYVLGINHKTAAVGLREKAYFPLEKLTLYLQDLLAQCNCDEAVLLSTCNRSELYCDTDDIDAIATWFRQQTRLTAEEFLASTYVYQNEKALFHMMEVACGLDSMILGEPQILGQMKAAFSESCTANAVGPLFHRLFREVFNVAKEIRTTTAIGACPVSVASAAIHFAKTLLPDFEKATVTLIGAGETAQILMRYLAQHPTQTWQLVNRHVPHKFPGKVYSLSQMSLALQNTDVVFSATGSPYPIVTKEMLAQSAINRLLTFIDIAVPRDIAEEVAELPNVKLYCIDDLKTIIETNRRGREHAALKAREMIAKKSAECLTELKSLNKVSHAIRTYRAQIEQIGRAELIKAKRQLHQGSDPYLVLDAFAAAFTKKLLHAPSVQLRQAGAEGRDELLQFAKQLFAIPDTDSECI